MVSVAISIPTGGNYFLLILKPLDVNCVQNDRNVGFMLFGKNANKHIYISDINSVLKCKI